MDKYGLEFLACLVFADRVLPDVNIHENEADFDKNSEVFNIAKQVNDQHDQLMRMLLSENKLVHTLVRDV